jgi:outer membrane lipoprotein-sorting protein
MKTTTVRLVILTFIFITAYHASAYIPTAEQLLQKTAAAHRHLTTMEALITTTVFDNPGRNGNIDATEHMYVKGADMFRSERSLPSGRELIVGKGRKAFAAVNEPSKVNIRRLETVFPLIYFHDSVETLVDDLNYLGVDTNIVAFDRINETVAFVIGTGNSQTPGSRLWIDKHRGFPLRFTGISTVAGKRVALRVDYGNYTQVKQRFWLPSRIDYYMNDILIASSTLTKVSINQPVDDSRFDTPVDGGPYLPVASFLTVKE